MGDDGETFSSNINKPSLEHVSEKQIIKEKKLNSEEEINNAEQCEFFPKLDDSNVPCNESEEVALGDELESGVVPQEEGIGRTEDKHGAVANDVDVEARTEAEVVVGGRGRLVAEEGSVAESNMEGLEEKVGEEKSEFDSGEKPVMDAECHVEMLGEETLVRDADADAELEKAVGKGENVVSGVGDRKFSGPELVATDVEAEGLVETGELPVDATVGDEEKNASAQSVVVAVREVEEVVETGDLQVEEANAGNEEKNACIIGAQLDAVEEAQKLVETGDFQVEQVTVGDDEKHASIVSVQSGAAVEEAKEVVETVDLQVEEATVGDGEKNASSIGISSQLDGGTSESVVATSNDVVVDEAVAMAEGEKPLTGPDKWQSIAYKSVTVEEDADMVAMPEESFAVVMGVEKEEDSPQDREAIVAEIVRAEIKVDMEISTQVAEVTEGEHLAGSHGSLFVGTEASNSAKEEGDKVRRIIEEEGIVGDSEMVDIKEMDDDVRGVAEKESLVANAEMDEIKQIEASENSVPNDLRFGGQESLIPSSIEENKESIPEEGIPTADTEMEKEIEAEMETNKIGDVESNAKIDDSLFSPQDEEDEEMVPEEGSALVETELETETDVGESSKAVGEKHKRGKNSKNLTNSKIRTRAQKLTDEDVCFICFDGGDLVLCDRR